MRGVRGELISMKLSGSSYRRGINAGHASELLRVPDDPTCRLVTPVHWLGHFGNCPFTIDYYWMLMYGHAAFKKIFLLVCNYEVNLIIKIKKCCFVFQRYSTLRTMNYMKVGLE